MPKKIFLGRISAQTTEAELQGLFRGMDGLASAKLERNATGGVRGVAVFLSDGDGTEVIRRLQGKALHGAVVRITADE